MDFRAALADLLANLADVADIRSLEAAIIAGDRARVRDQLRVLWLHATPRLRETLEARITEVADHAYHAAWELAGAGDVPPPTRAVDRALAQAAHRVTAMTSQNRMVINRLVTAAMAGGASNTRLASNLVGSGLGLDRVRAGALARFQTMLQALVSDGSLTQDAAVGRLDRARMKKIRSRAWTIARTETSDARGFARQQAWDDALRAGRIRSEDFWKVWLTSRDDKVEDVCRRLEGQRTTIDGLFDDGFMRPPRHPRCRCTVTLIPRTREEKEAAAAAAA